MAAKMKLLMKSKALRSAVEPYVLPQTPDVISIGKRCVELGWSFWWPPFSKRLVLTPPKGRGSPVYLSVEGNIPYVRERRSKSKPTAPAPVTNFNKPTTSPGSTMGAATGPDSCEGGAGAVATLPCGCKCIGTCGNATLVCEPCAPASPSGLVLAKGLLAEIKAKAKEVITKDEPNPDEVQPSVKEVAKATAKTKKHAKAKAKPMPAWVTERLGCSKCRRVRMGCTACRSKQGLFVDNNGDWFRMED